MIEDWYIGFARVMIVELLVVMPLGLAFGLWLHREFPRGNPTWREVFAHVRKHRAMPRARIRR